MRTLESECFGKNLKEIRTFLGKSQSDVAKESGLTPAAICMIELEERSPSLGSIVKILRTLNISFERMMCKKRELKNDTDNWT